MKVSSTFLSFRFKLTRSAHTIQNAQSQLAQACCALQAERRWVITGTPIQNKLTDFASILKFLRVYPYCDQMTFDEEISRPWRLADQEGFLRLKSLVRAITISRTKTVINLPARVDEIHHLEFSTEELLGYNAAKKETVNLFEEAISSGRQSNKTFNALARLNFLRLFCNLGLLIHRQPASATSSPVRDYESAFAASTKCDSFYSDVLNGSATCAQCGQALLDDVLEEFSSPSVDDSSFFTPAAVLCRNCKIYQDSRPSESMPLLQREQSSTSTASSAPSTPGDQSLLPFDSMPTKIKALVADLSKHCSRAKR